MATTIHEHGLEVPAAGGSFMSTGFNVLTNPESPLWDDWVVIREKTALSKISQLFRKDTEVQMDPDVFAGLSFLMDKPVKPKKPKKTVTWFVDVPYKEKWGEVFEGPVTSQLTFDKDMPVM